MDVILDSLYIWIIRTCDIDVLMYVMFFMELYNFIDFNFFFKNYSIF